MRPHTAVKQKILKMLEIRKSMMYNLQWKVNGLRAFPFTPSNDRIIARQSWILDTRNWIRNSLSEELGFWILIFSRIQVSLSWIGDSKAQDSGLRKQIFPDSGFHKHTFPAFRNPNSLTWGHFNLVTSIYLFYYPRKAPHRKLSLIHIWRCRRSTLCRSRWSPYH